MFIGLAGLRSRKYVTNSGVASRALEKLNAAHHGAGRVDDLASQISRLDICPE